MPRDPKRVERISNRLTYLWLMMPDMRLGQIVNYVAGHLNYPRDDIFYVEDDEWEQAIERAIVGAQSARSK